MRVAFVFPGQGSQKVGMGKELHEAFPEVRGLFGRASEAMHLDLAKLCFEGPPEELTRTDRAQPALLTLGVACHRLIAQCATEVAAVAGHSLGEYTALVASGALDFEQSICLVVERGRLMHECPSGAMAAIVGVERAAVEDAVRQATKSGIVVIANYNSPGQVVISGEASAVEAAMELAKKSGARQAVRLNVSGAFHSPLMDEAAQRLSEVIRKVSFRDPIVPVVANVDAAPKREACELRDALMRQMRSSVLWEESVSALRALGAEAFVECGPGRVLSGLIRRCDRNATTLNVEDLESLEATRSALAQAA